MKKLMKSLIITGICASIMASGFAFAGTDTQTKMGRGGQEGQQGGARPGHERMTEEEREVKDADHAERQTDLLNTVDTYASDLSDDFEDAFATAEELRTEMQTLRVANKPSDEDKEAMKEKMDTIREKVQAGEMTREEAKAEMDSNRPERPEQEGDKNQLTKEEHEALRVEQQAKGDAFRAAVDAGDADTIVEMLEEMLTKIQERNTELAAKLAEM